jgi:hypothetical protein
MFGGFIRRLFAPTPHSEEPTAGVRPDESLEALHAEFCRTFCHQPDVKFMDFLRSAGVTRLIDWLRSDTTDPLPKSFIRLAVDATRKGHRIWEKQGLSMFYEGNWTEGSGLPGQESLDALSVLAQVLGKPIKLYYKEKPDGPHMVMEFHP